MKTQELKEHHLILKHSVSKGRDTYGYNIVALWEGKKKYSTCGGGYDMLGSVFGEWLRDNYEERLKILKPYDEQYSLAFYQQHGYQPQQDNYGLFCRNGRLSIDGACGFNAMESLAKKIGLRVKRLSHGKKCHTIGFIITEEE